MSETELDQMIENDTATARERKPYDGNAIPRVWTVRLITEDEWSAYKAKELTPELNDKTKGEPALLENYRDADDKATDIYVDETMLKCSRYYYMNLTWREVCELMDGKMAVRRHWRKVALLTPKPKVEEGQSDRLRSCAAELKKAYDSFVQGKGKIVVMDRYTVQVMTSAAQWLAGEGKPWLMLRGNIGVGKTTLGLSVRRVLAEHGTSTEEIDAISIAEVYQEDKAEYQRLLKVKSLLIDDIGTEPSMVKQFGNETSPMAMMITERYRYRERLGLTTIITTNLSVEELTERYGARVVDRLRELCDVIKYDGAQPSYRG